MLKTYLKKEIYCNALHLGAIKSSRKLGIYLTTCEFTVGRNLTDATFAVVALLRMVT